MRSECRETSALRGRGFIRIPLLRSAEAAVDWPGRRGGASGFEGLFEKSGEAGSAPRAAGGGAGGGLPQGTPAPSPPDTWRQRAKVRPGPRGQQSQLRRQQLLSEQNPVWSSGACRAHEGPRLADVEDPRGGGNRSRDDPHGGGSRGGSDQGPGPPLTRGRWPTNVIQPRLTFK